MGYEQVALSVGGIAQAGLDVPRSQVGEVVQDVLGAHSRGEIREDIVHRDPHATDSRLAATLAGLEGDNRLIGCIHRILQADSEDLPIHTWHLAVAIGNDLTVPRDVKPVKAIEFVGDVSWGGVDAKTPCPALQDETAPSRVVAEKVP